MDQYLLIPFLGGWTSIYQLFDVHQGYKVLIHPHLCTSIGKKMEGMNPMDRRAIDPKGKAW